MPRLPRCMGQHLHIADRIKTHPLRDFIADETEDEFGDLFRFLAVHEGKIGAFFSLALGDASVADVVRGADDFAGLGLTEDFGETHGRNGLGGEQIGED